MPARTSPPADHRRRGLAEAALVATVAAAVFLGSVGHQPTLDDGWVVFQNPLVRGLDPVRIFTEPYNAGGPATTGGAFRPVTTLSYALNYAAGGHDGRGYHAANVALHALAAVLVLLLARRVVAAAAAPRPGPAALAAALLFALHPAHVEAVAALTGRAELLAAAGVLAALLLAGARDAGPGRLAAAAVAVAAGVLSKESAATAPALYLLLAVLAPGAVGLEARPGLDAPDARRALGRAAIVAGALAAGVLAWLLRPGAGLAVPEASRWFGSQPRTVVLGTMARAFVEYLRLLLFPHPLGADFTYAARVPSTPLAAPAALGALALLALVLGLALARARRAPLLAVAVLWGLGALVPVSNVLVPTGVLMAERLLYLPSVGFCVWGGDLLVGAALAARARAAGLRAAGAAGGLLAAALAAKTVARTAEWRSPRALYEAELRGAPRDPVVNNNLAVEYTAAGEYARARERLAVALEAAPGYWRAWVNLGIVQQRTGDLAGALASLERAQRIAHAEPSARLFAALALEALGRRDEAVATLREAARLGPEDPRPRLELGRLLAGLGRVEEARAELTRAAALDPRDPAPRRALEALGAAAEGSPTRER